MRRIRGTEGMLPGGESWEAAECRIFGAGCGEIFGSISQVFFKKVCDIFGKNLNHFVFVHRKGVEPLDGFEILEVLFKDRILDAFCKQLSERIVKISFNKFFSFRHS